MEQHISQHSHYHPSHKDLLYKKWASWGEEGMRWDVVYNPQVN